MTDPGRRKYPLPLPWLERVGKNAGDRARFHNLPSGEWASAERIGRLQLSTFLKSRPSVPGQTASKRDGTPRWFFLRPLPAERSTVVHSYPCALSHCYRRPRRFSSRSAWTAKLWG